MPLSRIISAEFEFMNALSVRAICQRLQQAGVNSMYRPAYTKGGPDDGFDFCVEIDPACRSGAFPQEIKTRPVTSDGWSSLVPPMLRTLGEMGSVLDLRAAYHVRVDMPEVESDMRRLNSLWNTVWQYENVIFGLVQPFARQMASDPLSPRCSLDWCRSERDYAVYLRTLSKTYGMNFRGVLWDTPVVEFRWHQGTLDPEEATLWAELMCGLVDYAMANDHPPVDRVKNTRDALEEFLSLVAEGCDLEAIRRKHRVDADDAPWHHENRLRRNFESAIGQTTAGIGLKFVGRTRQFA